jgi:hypothetical protein
MLDFVIYFLLKDDFITIEIYSNFFEFFLQQLQPKISLFFVILEFYLHVFFE